MKTLILTLIVLTFLGCNPDDEKHQYVLDVAFEFSIKDSKGNDLLDPKNQNSYNESDIKLFYLINGESIEVNDPYMDFPRNFKIYEYTPTSEYRIAVFVNHSNTEELPTTYIEWNETDTDTLKCEIYRESSITKIQKTWLNGELIWSPTDKTDRYFELIK